MNYTLFVCSHRMKRDGSKHKNVQAEGSLCDERQKISSKSKISQRERQIWMKFTEQRSSGTWLDVYLYNKYRDETEHSTPKKKILLRWQRAK